MTSRDWPAIHRRSSQLLRRGLPAEAGQARRIGAEHLSGLGRRPENDDGRHGQEDQGDQPEHPRVRVRDRRGPADSGESGAGSTTKPRSTPPTGGCIRPAQSSSKVLSDYGKAFYVLNISPQAKKDCSGQNFAQWFGNYAANEFGNPNPALDGIFTDNVFWKPRRDGDWNLRRQDRQPERRDRAGLVSRRLSPLRSTR